MYVEGMYDVLKVVYGYNKIRDDGIWQINHLINHQSQRTKSRSRSRSRSRLDDTSSYM